MCKLIAVTGCSLFCGRGLSLLLRFATCGVLRLTLFPQESSNPSLQSQSLKLLATSFLKVKSFLAKEKSSVRYALQHSKCKLIAVTGCSLFCRRGLSLLLRFATCGVLRLMLFRERRATLHFD